MQVLLVDDQPKMGLAFTKIIENLDHQVTFLASGTTALAMSDEQLDAFDVVMIDMNMDELDGCETGLQIKHRVPTIVTIMLTADSSVETVVKALRDSQFDDFLCKRDIAKDAMQGSPMLQETFLRADNIRATRKALSNEYQLSNALRNNSVEVQKEMIGHSWAMQKVRQAIEKVAPLGTTVLIRGEIGTGKELIAREIYTQSPRSHAPFVSVNCGAIPPDLLESELFGHTQGAIPGASGDREGFFKLADGGTLLLDEVGEIPFELQAKVARVLQDRVISPVGSHESFSVDVRIISTTHHDLPQKISEGRFREDLFYQLNVFPIEIVPLRERTSDIPPLIDHLITKKFRASQVLGVEPETLEMLQKMYWRGNVRELENVLERALVVTTEAYLTHQDFMENSEFAALVANTEKPEEDTSRLDSRKLEENRTYLQMLKQGWTREKLDRAGFPYHPELEMPPESVETVDVPVDE